MSAERFELFYTKNYDVEVVEYNPGRLSELIVLKDEDDDLCEGANVCDVGSNPSNASYISTPQDGKQPPATPQHPLTSPVVYIKVENNSPMTEDNDCMSEVNVCTSEDNDFMNEAQEEGNPTQANPEETTREVHPKKVDHKRDRRRRCTDEQLLALNKMYEQTMYPDAASKNDLAVRIGLPYRYVHRWFKRRIVRDNLKAKRELSNVANVEISEQVLRRMVPGPGGKPYQKESLLKRRIVKQRKRPRGGQKQLPLFSRRGAHCYICNRSDERITKGGRCYGCYEFLSKYLRLNKTKRSEVVPSCSHKGTQLLAGCKACLVFRYKQATLKKQKASQVRKKENQLSKKVQHCPSRSTRVRLSSSHQNNSCEKGDSSGSKISEHLTASLSEKIPGELQKKIDVTETSRSSSRHHNNSCEGEKSDKKEDSGSKILESGAALISEKISVEPQKKIDVTEKFSYHRLRSSSRQHNNSCEGEQSDEKGDSDTRDSEAATAPQKKIAVELRKKIDVTENLNKLRKIATTFFYSDLMDTKNRSKLFTEMNDSVNDIWAHVFDLTSTTRVEETEKGDFDTRDSDAATVPQKKIDVIENLNKLRKIATMVFNSDHMDTKNRSILFNEINDCVNDIWAHIFNFKSTTRVEESASSTEKTVCGKLLSPCSCSCKTHGNSLEMKIQSLEGIVMESGTRIRDLAYLVFTNQSNERDKPPSRPNELPYRNDAEFTPIIQPLARYQNSPSILTSYCQICDQSRSFATVNQLSICQLCINFMETRKILSHSNQRLLVPSCSHRGTQAKFGCGDCLVFRFNKVHAGLMPNVTSFGLEGSHLLGSQFYNNGHNISSNNPARLNLETFQSSNSISNHCISNSPSARTPPGQPPPDLSQASNNQLSSSNLTALLNLPRRGITPEVNPYQRVPAEDIQLSTLWPQTR